MSEKAIFLDRDNTLIEDPGYISDPDAVRLLPGVELAMKSLSQAGYLLVVVTNQSGVARGLLTEESLKKIHERMVELLSRKGALVDEIYYCPYHAEGSVPEYAIESDLRKPEPGMLLQAAEDMGIDLSVSWMVGDTPSDIEAGERAGCRTIRIRTPHDDDRTDNHLEEFQADYTVRNLVEAARVILRSGPGASAQVDAADEDEDVLLNIDHSAAGAPESATGVVLPTPRTPHYAAAEVATLPTAQAIEDEPVGDFEPELPAPAAAAAGEAATQLPEEDTGGANRVRNEILRELRQMARSQMAAEEFSVWRLVGTIVQVLTFLALLMTVKHLVGQPQELMKAQVWGILTVALQTMALTLVMMQRRR
ncbi:hypothetical protein LCGC14_0451400 [marine sediment metagenome]|uniref:D,D-heptose 1,7-bisphosphate phosphatase n=1 Tax=marine sediment metagenome TaxID=412755 RepID=A0A0F9T0X0_9ZZZZ|nr:HAD family hydrolase [Phycisphaerae bacterium]HDZ42771.1 HAD family hydrolase [Phycisphaerae bacterium]